MNYGIARAVDLPYDQAVERVTEELKKEGFGVLTTIDVRETLKKKLELEFKRYVILGACNPPLAYRALCSEEQIGLLLPCNVIVYEKEGGSMVSAFDPMAMMRVLDNEEVRGIAAEVQQKMQRVIDRV